MVSSIVRSTVRSIVRPNVRSSELDRAIACEIDRLRIGLPNREEFRAPPWGPTCWDEVFARSPMGPEMKFARNPGVTIMVS
eukprot:9479125-Pyramimonas_sp.AAC.3